MSLGKTHYLMSQDTHQALAGPMTCAEVVNIINAMEKSRAVHYYNSSRYDLYKHGRYPRNQAGDAALARDVELAKTFWVETLTDLELLVMQEEARRANDTDLHYLVLTELGERLTRQQAPAIRLVSAASPTIIDGRLVKDGRLYDVSKTRYIRYDFGREVWQGCNDLAAKDWHDLEEVVTP